MRHLLIVFATISVTLCGCTATTVEVMPSELGQTSSMQNLMAVITESGPIVFEKHTAADWQVPLSGLLNLDHPKAVEAGLIDRDEPIELFVYSLQHPIYGTYIIDSGISERFIDAGNNPDVAYLVKQAMNISALDVRLTTAQLAEQKGDIAGVLLTHIHLDHIMGLTDLDASVPVFIGPGDASLSTVIHAVTRGTTDRLLANVSYLQEWQFNDSGVIDVFGDGSVWAIHSPGHTPGTTVYLARTTDGPQLMIGDVTHTRWGWDNGVEPGTYSEDGATNAASLNMLRSLARNNPSITVHPGHQH